MGAGGRTVAVIPCVRVVAKALSNLKVQESTGNKKEKNKGRKNGLKHVK